MKAHLSASSIPVSLSITSLTKKWLLLRPNFLVASSDPRMGVVTGRNANFLMISVQRLEREPYHSRLAGTRHPHLRLLHPELVREGTVTPLREMFATSTGTLVSVTADLTVHLNIRRTPTHSPAAPTLPAGLKMRKTPRTQL